MKIKKFLNVNKMVFTMIFAMVITVVLFTSADCFASKIDAIPDATSYQWPWTQFFAALATELSGPLPMMLGIIAIAGAAFSLFSGNGGAGTQKFFVLIFAIGICLFAPSFINYIYKSASASTIYDVIQSGVK